MSSYQDLTKLIVKHLENKQIYRLLNIHYVRRIYASMFFMIIAMIILSVDKGNTVIAIWALERPQPLVQQHLLLLRRPLSSKFLELLSTQIICTDNIIALMNIHFIMSCLRMIYYALL